jgi:putative SOS response-associated peptidase YedK
MNEDGDVVAPEDMSALPLHTYPKYQAPVVIQTEAGRSITLARWGVRLEFKNPTGPKLKYVTNARDDKLCGFTWRYCTAERRCLIPVRAYYEPEGPEGQTWEVRFTVIDRDAFFIAGIWDMDPDHSTKSFSMVTTRPNALAPQTQDRMPLVLNDEGARLWLGHTPLQGDDFANLCRPFPAEAMARVVTHRERTQKKVTTKDLSDAQGELLL